MKENENVAVGTDKGTSDETEKKSELRSGALRSSLAVELHTRYAILLWEGQYTKTREKDGRKVSHRRIMGMPYFLRLVNRINEDSLKDDPFADEKMYLLEQEFNRGTGRLEKLVTELDNILKNVPARISLSEALSVSPVNISVFSRTPVGYRCVWLLVGFDQLALKAFQASHYGLISHARRDEYLRMGAQSIHRAYGLVLGYRSSGITRRDILQNRSALTEQMASLDEDILLGKKRSSFSPPVSKESIALLRSARNAGPESISAPDAPSESRLPVDPQTGSDSLTR
ncbi:TIGR03761 family integrating conjugative element protein [Salmonella enterica subsp. enterica serovar Emek]|nr:TIGR03761 family integrating conjugative element protein [Salmonella enterica subsp. enterica serovar Emek]